MQRRYAMGAEPTPGGVDFRVWAPAAASVHVCLEAESHPLKEIPLKTEGDGWFSGLVREARPGSLYRFRLDDKPNLYPDPASRFQPEGPHGPSQVIDPGMFEWHDESWPGIERKGQIIYELHCGTFTSEGTWNAAAEQIEELASAGITVIETMPVADFPGRFGWGYDGVNMFAPTRLYGTADDLRGFIDRAHRAGMGVILDVVYNHFGPDGNYHWAFSRDYQSAEHKTDWGTAINFSGANSEPVREFYLANAAYWIDEFHFDGLRLDATQDIHDESTPHIIQEIGEHARRAAVRRKIIVVAENEPQQTKLARPIEHGGYGLDALWNDDFHHSAMVALTGRSEAYYTDYNGSPQEFVSSAKYGYLYQGQRYSWQKNRRGVSALGMDPANFITFLQNHDQVANRLGAARPNLRSSPGRYRALTALLLLGPGTPMLFQGQEFGATTPFLFFSDHGEELSRLVWQGRAKFLTQFPSFAGPEMQESVPDPADPKTFEACKLDFRDRIKNRAAYDLHKDLIALRRNDPVFSAQRMGGVDGAVLSEEAFLLRYFGDEANGGQGDRLVLINLGRDSHLLPASEPLLAPPLQSRWTLAWSSEDPRYGGDGVYPPESCSGEWTIAGHSAVAMRSEHIDHERVNQEREARQ